MPVARVFFGMYSLVCGICQENLLGLQVAGYAADTYMQHRIYSSTEYSICCALSAWSSGYYTAVMMPYTGDHTAVDVSTKFEWKKVEHLFAWWRYSEMLANFIKQINVLGIGHVGVQPQHRGRQLPECDAICADALLLAYYSVWYDITGCTYQSDAVVVLQQYTPLDIYATLCVTHQAGQGGKTPTKNNERRLTTVLRVGAYY